MNIKLQQAESYIKTKAEPLNKLVHRNQNTKQMNYKLHHLLHDPFIYINAYSKISKNKGALSKGVIKDEDVMQSFSLEKAQHIANKIKKNKHRWKDVRRVWIKKPGKNTFRPIDTPTQEDRIIQEAIRGILEAIFEPEFKEFEMNNGFRATNYGFRPHKSTWDAIENIKYKGQRAIYAIEGDIKGAYNNIDHKLMMSFLSKRIKDKKFLQLIYELLKSGIMDKDGLRKHTLKGTPQGGIVSPILFNIYMFSFDKFIYENYVKPSTETKYKPKINKQHKNLGYQIKTLLTKWKKSNKSKEAKENYLTPLKQLQKQRLSTPSKDIHTLPHTAHYFRYADDWVLLITCDKTKSLKVKEEIKQWLQTNLRLELDETKTILSKLINGFQFLGYSIKMTTPKQNKKTYVLSTIHQKTTRVLKRTTSRKITVTPDKKRLLSRLVERQFCEAHNHFPTGKPAWTVLDEFEIVLKYRQTMIGLSNYYKHCDCDRMLNYTSYILQYSCAKTLARRKKKTLKQIFCQYGKSLQIVKQIETTNHKRTIRTSFPTFPVLKNRLKSNPESKTKNDLFDPFKTATF
jgi:group II intron reverse transcriptase/maturase